MVVTTESFFVCLFFMEILITTKYPFMSISLVKISLYDDIFVSELNVNGKLQTDIQCQRNFEIIFFHTYILSQKMQSCI